MKKTYEALTIEAVDLLCRLIEIPSFSRQEEAATAFLKQWLTNHGLYAQCLSNNLILYPAWENRKHLPTVLLNAHIDTVHPTKAWKRNPLKASIEGERIYGLGSNDDGASLVTLIQVMRLLLEQQETLYFYPILAISAEEEVSGKNGMESLIPQLGRIDVAIVGEPTGMQPAIAEKGLMVLDVTAHGRPGHAAREEGENAIYHALDDIQWFRTHQWEKTSPLLGKVKMSVTLINAGTQHNVIPAECTFTVDIRSNEMYTNEELFLAVQKAIHSEVKARSFRLNSSRINTQHPLVVAAKEMGLTPYGSPTLSDQALMPWPSMKIGPGKSERSHSADEFILISEIREAIEIYHKLLLKAYQGAIA